MSNTGAVPVETSLFIRDHCLCLHVQRAARALARRFDEALRPLELKSGQFSLLVSLNRPQPPSLGSVAALLAMDRTTLTANLKPLERRGLVTVSTDPADRRTRRLRLTEAGMAMLQAAIPIWEGAHRQVEARLEDGAAGRMRAELRMLGEDGLTGR